MIRVLARAIAVAALGALAGAVGVTVAFALHPDFTLEMDGDLPRNVTGIYPTERAPNGDSFAWTGRSAKISLPGLDRRVPWTCVVRLRGARAEPVPQPVVAIDVDGVRAATRAATNTLEDMEALVPARATRPGLVLTVTSSATVVPGPGDPRELGVQIDRLQCRPADGIALPPRRALGRAMLAAAAFGAAFGAIGITAGSAVGAALLLAAVQAFPLVSGAAPYTAYIDRASSLAWWIAAMMVFTTWLVQWRMGHPLRQTARFAIAFAAAALYLKLLAILHPSKLLVDAVFHAHRFEAVLAGGYFFTQPLGAGGIHFPYAIGLYVFAIPWSVLTKDHVTLLRLIVCASECVAGALLYPVITRAWGDRLAGAIASALVTMVPVTYWVVGNANLTNAFGQSAALVAMALVILWSTDTLTVVRVIAMTIAIAVALLSHVSTFATLSATLVTLGVLFLWLGGPPLRRPARAVLLATALAIVFSIAVYYGHFGPVYLDALRLRGKTPIVAVDRNALPSGAPASSRPADQVVRQPEGPIGRLGESLRVVGQSFGWPLLVLAAIGGWQLTVRRGRDPLRLALVAWGVGFVVMFGVGVMRVDPAYQRYALEFVSRVAFATYPAAVILAGFGAGWAWRSGMAARAVGVALLGMAVAVGVREWVQMWR
jgi:hypothetical protein